MSVSYCNFEQIFLNSSWKHQKIRYLQMFSGVWKEISGMKLVNVLVFLCSNFYFPINNNYCIYLIMHLYLTLNELFSQHAVQH